MTIQSITRLILTGACLQRGPVLHHDDGMEESMIQLIIIDWHPFQILDNLRSRYFPTAAEVEERNSWVCSDEIGDRH